MADALTATGLNIDSLDDRIEAAKALLRSAISSNLDLTADQPTGQLTQIQYEAIQAALELLRATYSAWDPDSATGHSLTALALCTGTERRPATHGTVTLTCNLNGGTTLGIGTMASVTGDPTNLWEINESFTAPAGPAADYFLDFTATEPGAIQALAGTIIVMATPVGGWNSVDNAAAAAAGEEEETDTALRLRRELELARAGSATVDAIRADLIALEGMISVDVYENDLDIAVGGIPAHAFWTVIWDGAVPAVANADIAEAIFQAKAAGIRPYGYTTVAHVDEQGNSHPIAFTRAAEIAIAVEVTIPAANRGADYPGDAAVAQAIEDWAVDFYGVGDDVYRSEIVGVVVQLPGVENVSLCRLATAPVPPGVFAAVDMVFGVAQIATIAAADVVVL